MTAHNLPIANSKERLQPVVNCALVLKRYFIQINCWNSSCCTSISALLIYVINSTSSHWLAVLRMARNRAIPAPRPSRAISSGSAVDWFAIRVFCSQLRCERFDLLGFCWLVFTRTMTTVNLTNWIASKVVGIVVDWTQHI